MMGLVAEKRDEHKEATLYLLENYEKKIIFFCTDGLTLGCMGSFKKRSIDVKHSFKSNFTNTKFIKSELNQAIEISVPLRIDFHIL